MYVDFLRKPAFTELLRSDSFVHSNNEKFLRKWLIILLRKIIKSL